MRRIVLITLFLLSTVGTAAAQQKDTTAPHDTERAATTLITPAAEQSIDRGLKWLAAQQHDDGGFATGPLRGNVAICALSGMAFMSNGSTPGRGPYGEQVNRCTDYILANTRPSGFISADDTSHGPMYGHGFALTYLAECYGMSPQPEVREKLAKAVKIVVQCQNKEGGWRYQPVAAEADISVTACQVMALRAARNAGLFVPSDTIDRAIDYIKRCQNADGGFSYMLQRSESAFPRSAAAVVALYSAGVHQGPEIQQGLDYLLRFLPAEGVGSRESYYFYGQYYAAQAMWHSGGDRWTRWYPAVRDELIGRQRDDGSWTSAESNECATAMACLVLQMPNNVLPILQR